MPTLHIVRKVRFPLIDAGTTDCSVQKIAAAIIDDVDRSLSQHVVQIPSGSHDSHVGDDGAKTTTSTTSMYPSATDKRSKPNPCKHEPILWKEKTVATVSKSVPRIEESNPSQPSQPESSLPTSLRQYPSVSSLPTSRRQYPSDHTVPISVATSGIPPPTRLTKNVVTQDDGIVGSAGVQMTQMALPAAGTSKASSSARAKRASFDVSKESSKDNRASHLPPRKRLKYNYIDALKLLTKDEKAVTQEKKDVGPSHTTLPQLPVATPISLGESAETPKRIAVCTEEECDMAAALMSLPSKTPSSPGNSSSPKSTTITDGASLLSSIHIMSAGRPTGSAAPTHVSPTSPTQPPLIFDIGAWFDQGQPGERDQEQSRRHVEPRAAKSRPKYKDAAKELVKSKKILATADKSMHSTCSSDPNSFFPSRLRTLLERAEDDGLVSVFSWQVRLRCVYIIF